MSKKVVTTRAGSSGDSFSDTDQNLSRSRDTDSSIYSHNKSNSFINDSDEGHGITLTLRKVYYNSNRVYKFLPLGLEPPDLSWTFVGEKIVCYDKKGQPPELLPLDSVDKKTLETLRIASLAEGEKLKDSSIALFLMNPWVAGTLIVVFGVLFTFGFGSYAKIIPAIIASEKDAIKTCSSVLESNQLYPMENPLFWRQIQVGIEHVQNDEPPSPAVFILVHSDRRTAQKIINRITETVTLCLDSTGGALYLSSNELTSNAVINDYGILIPKYQSVLETKRVMIVHDIQNVPATVAPVFHVFCDTTSPVVKKSALFFTIQMNEEEIPEEMNHLIDTVEMKLKNLWKNGVNKDKIQPLITRLTDNVLHIKIKE